MLNKTREQEDSLAGGFDLHSEAACICQDYSEPLLRHINKGLPSCLGSHLFRRIDVNTGLHSGLLLHRFLARMFVLPQDISSLAYRG